MDLLSNAEHLAKELQRVNPGRHETQRKCIQLIADIKTFVTALGSLLAILREPKLEERSACREMIDCMVEDMERTVDDLSTKLEQSEQRNKRIRRRFRSFFGEESKHHPIALFFNPSHMIDVRQAQINYAAAVSEVVHFAALHAISAGYSEACFDDQQGARNQQLSKIDQEWSARCALQTKISETNDDFVAHRLWLRSYRVDTDMFPLHIVATLWFEDVVIDHSDLARHFRKLGRQQQQTQTKVEQLDRDLLTTRTEVTRLQSELESSRRRYAELHDRYNNLKHRYTEEAKQWRKEMKAIKQKNFELKQELDKYRPPNAYNNRNRRNGSRDSSSSHQSYYVEPSRSSSRDSSRNRQSHYVEPSRSSSRDSSRNRQSHYQEYSRSSPRRFVISSNAYALS